MQKSDLRILIIEDDPTLGKAIEEGIKRAGYKTYLANGHSAAMKALKINEFHGIVSDCMLPQKSGIDVVADIQKELNKNLPVILVSGIFKDKSYAIEAQNKTKAIQFLSKPFDISEIISIFDQSFQPILDTQFDPLFDLLAREQYSSRDKVSALQKTEQIHGYDLPYIYALLYESNIIGELEIHYSDTNICRVGFRKGRIELVDYKDAQSFFGVLLIERGLISPEVLEENLKQKSPRPIGERLVENSQLSPHAIDLIRHDQMIIRLSKTIQDMSLKIRFIEKTNTEPQSTAGIEGIEFTQFLSDSITSKISSQWLSSFYTHWLEHPLLKGPDFSKLNLIKSLPVAKTFANFILDLAWPHTLQELLNMNSGHEDDFLRAVHFFLSQRILYFGPKSSVSESFEAKIVRFEKILSDMQDQDYFAMLGVSQRSKSSDINKAYLELAKSLHPDKIAQGSPAKLKDLSQKIFSNITAAYQTLSQEQKRQEYIKSLELGHAEELLVAESNFEAAYKLLKSNQFSAARKRFEEVLAVNGHRSDTIVYFMWAYIKEKRKQTDAAEIVSSIQIFMAKVAHEDRHSPQYFFVKGMTYELSGQIEKAYQNFKHCLSLDPDFIDAKREMSFIKQNYAKSQSGQSILTEDLSNVLSRLFKKKTG